MEAGEPEGGVALVCTPASATTDFAISWAFVEEVRGTLRFLLGATALPFLVLDPSRKEEEVNEEPLTTDEVVEETEEPPDEMLEPEERVDSEEEELLLLEEWRGGEGGVLGKDVSK